MSRYDQRRSILPGIFIPDNESADVYVWLVRIMVISLILVGFVELIANMMHNSTIIDTSRNISTATTLAQVSFGSIIVISSVLVGMFSFYYANKYNAISSKYNDASQIGILTISMYILLFIILIAYGAAILGAALERSECLNNNLLCISTVPNRVGGPITLV